jgi:hypothetical protein
MDLVNAPSQGHRIALQMAAFLAPGQGIIGTNWTRGLDGNDSRLRRVNGLYFITTLRGCQRSYSDLRVQILFTCKLFCTSLQNFPMTLYSYSNRDTSRSFFSTICSKTSRYFPTAVV